MEKEYFILQYSEGDIKAPKPDQNSRQIILLESPPGKAALLTVVGWD